MRPVGAVARPPFDSHLVRIVQDTTIWRYGRRRRTRKYCAFSSDM
jgi:hypothetical protein